MQLVGSLCKRHAVASRLRPLVNERFQVLFHSPPGVLPTFPSRYWSTIGLPGIFSLAAWSPQIQTGFLVSRPTQVASVSQPRYPYGTFTLSGPTFQTVPVPGCSTFGRSYNPACAETHTVWAPPLSLATTQGIDLSFSSCRY